MEALPTSQIITKQEREYTIDYDRSHVIKNIRGLFYNCTSLTSFSFSNLYFSYYDSVKRYKLFRLQDP